MLKSILNKRFLYDSITKKKVFAFIEEKVELPKLPYGYKDLEPVISEEIMRLHHTKHHQAYINKYLDAMKFYVNELSIHVSHQDLEKVNFNGGGHINHSIFWKSLIIPSQAHQPPEELMQMIVRDFESFDKLLVKIKSLASEFQGSGWIWLGYDMTSNTLVLSTTYNQGVLQMETGLIPVIGIDLWEHAYYLQYKNDRATYVDKILTIMNWNYALSVIKEKQARAKLINESKY
ncbi:Superoxide dismutase [Mn], mitochondrial [Thelohanellus kitauei]|uniref:Superoxide dismutase n=1 Tax=Thelohanellus kitauei TaxID=669202 RepID=A0A0C2MSY9_THEKT|nr:Superoxide dismutase [Mn], mitochondrial [Thelohanellus kitauei]